MDSDSIEEWKRLGMELESLARTAGARLSYRVCHGGSVGSPTFRGTISCRSPALAERWRRRWRQEAGQSEPDADPEAGCRSGPGEAA